MFFQIVPADNEDAECQTYGDALLQSLPDDPEDQLAGTVACEQCITGARAGIFLM